MLKIFVPHLQVSSLKQYVKKDCWRAQNMCWIFAFILTFFSFIMMAMDDTAKKKDSLSSSVLSIYVIIPRTAYVKRKQWIKLTYEFVSEYKTKNLPSCLPILSITFQIIQTFNLFEGHFDGNCHTTFAIAMNRSTVNLIYNSQKEAKDDDTISCVS